MTMSFGEIAGNDSSDEVAPGEVRKFVAVAEIPEDSQYELEFAFIVPSNSTGKLEICDAAIESVGDNLPCIDKHMDPTLSSTYVICKIRVIMSWFYDQLFVDRL